MNYTITSKDNKFIKMVKSLNQKKYREFEEKYFIEGIKIISEAVKQKIKLEDIIICPEVLNKVRSGAEFGESLERTGYRINYVPEKIFNEICSTETPQGILAVISQKEYDLDSLALKTNGFYIVLDGISDPGNLGTIIRTADAAGADGVFLSDGCTDVFSPKTLRATMGSVFRVNVFENINLEDMLHKMKQNGIKILAASIDAKKLYFEEDFGIGTAVVIGSEAHGIRPVVQDLADSMIRIPMSEQIDSLNASVAAGILIYERFRRTWKAQYFE